MGSGGAVPGCWRNGRVAKLFSVLLVALLACGCDLDPGKVDAIVHADDVVPRRVETASGPVVGAAAAAGQAFLGIPYAAPPVGALRWREPRPVASWAEPRQATALGPSCLQNLSLDAQIGRAGAGPFLGQEDCLTLNVYAPPAAAGGQGRPVMVWIHGGAFVLGTSGQYDPSTLARNTGAVVVTVNYRLGALGFLAHSALRGTPGEGAFALLDQQAALRWIRTNVAGFGGDPRRVTLFGQSAGAWSTCDQLASPGAAGLFARAILESGACVTPATSLPAAAAEEGGRRLGASLGCDGPEALACLRARSAEEILSALPERDGVTGPNSWAPVTGLDVLPVPPREAFATGRFNRVPVIDGTNRDEGRLFGYLRGLQADLLTAGSYEAEISRLFGTRAAAILARYPADTFDSAGLAYAAVLTDGFFACQARALDRLLARFVPVFAYEFDDPGAPFRLPVLPWSARMASYHTAEIPFVFDTAWVLADPASFDADESRLSSVIQADWGAFARSGHPDGGGPSWPRFGAGAEVIEGLSPSRVGPAAGFAERHRCAFWDADGG